LLEQAATLAPGLIRFIGEIPPGEVPAHLDAADIFILPSRYEGMSNSALEAMERGLPLLITACGGIDTYVGADMGWVVPANDPVALASTLRMACDMPRPTLSTMGANCRRLAEQEFGMSRVAQRYLDLFDSLIHENRRRHT
jgi:glycosyltransferase involved in cell wall biosynthesis